MLFDLEEKRPIYKAMPVFLVKLFDACCNETEENGKKEGVTSNDIPYGVVQEIGSSILLKTNLTDEDKKKLKRS